MSYLFVCYPRCSTCSKAKQFLLENGIEFIERNIKEDNPSKEELKEWFNKSEFPIKQFFNTSGKAYKDLNLKEKLLEMTEEEKIELLATDGMLVKRPILVGEDKVLVGFKEKEWKSSL